MKIKIIIFLALSIIIPSVITGCQSEKKVTEATETTVESNTSEKETMKTSTAKSPEAKKARMYKKQPRKRSLLK